MFSKDVFKTSSARLRKRPQDALQVNNPVVNNPVVNNPVVNNPIVNNPIVNNPIVNSPWKIQLVRLRCFFIGDDDYSAISDHVQCHLTNSIIFQIMFSVT